MTGIQPRANPGRQVYRYDTTTGETLLVSATADGLTSALAAATDPVISADGSHVAFASVSTDIVSGLAATLDQNLFVRDMENARTSVATLDMTGTRPSADCSFKLTHMVYRFQAMDATWYLLRRVLNWSAAIRMAESKTFSFAI